MNTRVKLFFIFFLILDMSAIVHAEEMSKTKSGEMLFVENCSRCHPNGGNIINPSKTLKQGTLAANNLQKEDALLTYLLNPGPGMPRLIHRDTGLSEPDARKLIHYIMETFK